jgi:hypothetical protein
MERRTLDALSVFVLGLGLMLFLLAPCAGVYSLGHGLVALVATWVTGHTLRTYFLGFVDEDSKRRHR